MVAGVEAMGCVLDANSEHLGNDVFWDGLEPVNSSGSFVTKTHGPSSPEKETILTEPLSSEHRKILDLIGSNVGSMAQKELHKYLDYSEGKVSLILLYLERRGHIRKIRKGRGNILF